MSKDGVNTTARSNGLIEHIKKRRTLIVALSAVIVFATVYALILPAITLDKETAGKQGGIDVVTEQSADTDAQAQEADQNKAKKEDQKDAAARGQLLHEGKGYSLKAAYGEKAGLPEDTELEVEEVTDKDKEYQAWYDETLKALQESKGGSDIAQLTIAKFYDISLTANGDTLAPEAPVDVTITYDKSLKAKDADQLRIVHFIAKKDGSHKAEILDSDKVEPTIKEGELTKVSFEAEAFSMYAVAYAEAEEDADAEADVEADEETGDKNEEKADEVEGTEDEESEETEGVDEEEKDTVETEAIDEDNAEETEEADEYEYTLRDDEEVRLSQVLTAAGTDLQVKDVNNVIFSDKSRVKVKKNLFGYDWTLQALKGFDSEETLTVIQKSGERIEITLKNVWTKTKSLTADGKEYTIEVLYGQEAAIPEGAELIASEISSKTEDYSDYLEESVTALGVSNSDVSFARFFDIEIVKDGKKIEPEAPVQVKISYKDALELGQTDELNVVHFAESETEVIHDVAIADDAKEVSYEQGGFSVTGTIISGAPSVGSQYVLVIKKNNKYYSVHSDGTLEQVTDAYDPDTNTIRLDVEYPLLWTYSGLGDTQYHNISIPAVAEDFWPNNLPNHYFYRFINPNASDGYAEENSDSKSWMRNWSALAYENHTIHGVNHGNAPGEDRTSHYIGISEDGQRIVGLATESSAAEIYLATVSIPAADATHDNHMVNHIDISIAGNSSVSIPLAYGDYYDANGQKVFTATKADHVVTMSPSIEITEEDMKHADIKATAMVDGVRTELSDVFYITGYSQNHETSEDAPAQVRVEGAFKVANLPTIAGADNNPEVCQQRKDNPIDYTVTVVKTIQVDAEYNGQKLYDAQGRPISFSVPVALSGSFNYWDEGNKCPPVHEGYNENADFVQEWKDGKIVGGEDLLAMSGMDFELGTVASGQQHSVPAIEISKSIQDDEGNYLESTKSHNVDVNVYYKKKATGKEDDLIDVGVDEAVSEEVLAGLTEGYSKVHSKEITVGEGGLGAIYDYDVNEGLIYIKEDEKSVDQYITGTDGKRYQYVSTRMETEYAWRTDGDEHKVHNADGTTSVPEVLGEYSYEGEGLNNTFLVFHIYNIYKEIETVDVPVDKSWHDDETGEDLGDEYTWTSTFVLEEMEVHEDGPTSADANTSIWRTVEGVDPITISKGDRGDAITFKDLPKYRYYPNGSVYRILYSVDETAYELKKNGETVSKWDKSQGLIAGDVVYEPHWPHDAGDADDEMHLEDGDELFYHVIVENHESDAHVKETFTDFRIKKKWEDGAIEQAGVSEREAYATFQLKRFVQREHLSYDAQYYDGTDATVTLIGQDGNTDTLTVKKGARVNIVATFSSSATGSLNYAVDGTGQTYNVSRWWDGDEVTKKSNDITVTGNMTIRVSPDQTINITEDHLVLAAGAGSETSEDVEFTNEKLYYTLNRENGWIQEVDNLPKYAESEVKNGEQNIYHYSYYWTEVDSNPSGFYSTFTDGNGNAIGDAGHRVTEDHTTVIAENKPIPDFFVEKKWHDIEDPDSYPEIRFTLYQGLVGSNGKIQEGSVFVGTNGEKYENIPLNSDNNWKWKCPGFLPTKDEQGRDVGYYAVESTNNESNGRAVNLYENSTLNADGSIAEAGDQIPAATANKDQVWLWDYYNDQNDNRAYRNDQQMPRGWEGGFAGNEGTLTIVNRSPKYMQMDIKKKIMEYQEDGSLATTTGWASRTKDIVLKIQLMRRVYLADDPVDAEPLVDWTNYGVPFYVGYDSNGHDVEKNDNDFDVGVATSSWEWTILDQNQENGLPAYGYYTKDNGEVVKVHYRYIPFEVGAYKNLKEEPLSEEFDWFVGLQPNAWDGAHGQVRTFQPLVGQDQDRIMNIQASDLEVDKEWGNTPDNVEEVYVKIWRQAGNQEVEDFTHDIATRTDILDVYGFVDDPTRLKTLDNGVLVLGLTPETGGVVIHNVLMTPEHEGDLDSHYYEYWIEEVGYKDKDGNIYLNSQGDDVTSTFFPEYDKSDSSGSWTSNWTTDPANNKLKLSTKGKNKLRVKNLPTKDIEVVKEWYDENGNKLTGPWNKPDSETPAATSINFKVKRSDGQYLTFNGEDKLTILGSTGQRAVVRTDQIDSTAYTVTYVDDAHDEAAIDPWTTLIHGLEKYSSAGTEYTYTIEEVKNQNGKPLNGAGEVINNCHTIVTGGGSSFTIMNEKVSTSLSIRKTFGGSVTLTDAQKKLITFEVTGPNGFHKTFTYGEDQNPYKWNNGVLVIGNIAAGDYTVTEHNDAATDIFGADTTFSHTRTYTVGTTETTDSAAATVTEGERTEVEIVNTYDDQPPEAEIKLLKVDAETEAALAGAKFSLSRSDTATGIYTAVTEIEGVTMDSNHWFTVPAAGLTIPGLTPGFYRITEEEAPAGYLIETKIPLAFQVKSDGTIEDLSAAATYVAATQSFTVSDPPGTELPNSGGPGTTWIYLIGAILLLGCGISLIARRRVRRGI